MCAGAVGSWLRAIAGATGIALAVVRLTAQAPAEDLLSELALRIAASVAPDTFVSLDASTDEQTGRDVTDRLAARGVRVVEPADGRPSLRVRCDDNLREHTCAAEIAAASPVILIVARPRVAVPVPEPRGVLELRPVLSLHEPILDLAMNDDRMLVLTPSAVVKYEQDDGNWRRDDARPIPPVRVWPRDVRGRFQVSGNRFEAYLPGVTCTGDAGRLTMTCGESAAPWPVSIEGARFESARNYFRTPDGQMAYGMAPLRADAGARWLVVGSNRALTFVDDMGQRAPTTVSGDDVVAVRANCASSHVVVASRTADRTGDQLTMFLVMSRRLLPAGSPIRVSGRMTALWPAAGGDGATVVTYDQDAGRYDAHHLTVACPR